MATNSPTHVVTGKVRFSFVYISKPRPNDRGEDKYSITILLPKSDKATYAKLRAAERAGATKKFPGKPEEFYKRLSSTIHDGDGYRPSGEKFGSECKGCWVFSASSNERPGVVDADTNPLMEPIKSGDYGRVSVNAYGYSTSGKTGTSFGLNNIQLLERGESLSGRNDAATDFGGGFEDEEPSF